MSAVPLRLERSTIADRALADNYVGLAFLGDLLGLDGLPADAWTNVDNSLGGRASIDGERPFNETEMKTVFGIDLPAD